MFTIPKGSIITSDIVAKAVEYNEKKVPHYNELEAYYDGDHDILRRKKVERFKNNTIVVNHAEYITDLKVGYFIGNPVTYSLKLDYKSGKDLKPVLEEYEEQDISTVDQEIATEVSKFGKYYERIYLDGNNVRSALLDVRNCVFIHDNSTMHEVVAVVIYQIQEKNRKEIVFEELLVLDKTNIYDWKSVKGTISESVVSIQPHNFTQIPVIKYSNNRKETGDYEKVLTLINAYNIVTSDRVNDKEQLVEAILAIKGMKFPDHMASSLKENRIIADIPIQGGVEFLTKELNEDQLHILKKDLEDDIFKISKTPNMTDENFIGNSSGVALKYKLLPFELATTTKETYFKHGLKQRFVIYNDYKVGLSKSSEIKAYMLNVEFKRSLPQNDYETSQTIVNLDGKISDETLIKQISFVENAEDEVKEARKQQKAKMAGMAEEFATDNPTSEVEGTDTLEDEQEN